ncbi:MAG: UDP-N-acetylglucosamine 2-epimerase (hydrolyzing) [Muribaculaceae bacterium]|nr:UDP-N-acetylglucosamine 2-epimerase (hydrolyzing) [Muribaculaceae bacterium]
MRKILIATTTRADWGILSPLARALSSRLDCKVDVLATNMHLDPARGNTIQALRDDGFEPLVAPMPVGFEGALEAAQSMGECLASSARVISEAAPDLIVILGDRFEALAIASAAVMLRIPIVHIHGGEITEGAFDDSFRHAITKLASLHLTATEAYRRRVIQMGENPERVFNVGALGVAPKPVMRQAELEADLNWQFGENALLLTLHPETLSSLPAGELAKETFKALDHFPVSNILITYPNNDPGAEDIISAIEAYAADNCGRVKVIPSMGAARYFSALRCVKAVVGNSSSGIIEVPSVGIPTVNIGNRQAGRVAADSVINCAPVAAEIADAVSRAFAMDCSEVRNPYEQPNTLGRMTGIIAETPLEILREPKRFYDL